MANSSNLAFCLEYSNHKTDMMDAFDDYLRNESMVDVMLSCEGNTIKAHKMVLSAGSTYFRNIFSAFKNPFQFPVLIIKDMPFRDLKAIVQFLYRGEVVVPVEQVSSLSKSAQTLFIKGLEKYFNKSAMVNVGNHSTGANTANTNTNTNTISTSTNPSANNSKICNTSAHNVVNASKAKSKSIMTGQKRSISMSLRKTRRPDYRQLSNGDFNSGDENGISDDEYLSNQVINIGRPVTHVTYGRRSQSQLSRRIKSELVYNEGYETETDVIPHLEIQSFVDSNQMEKSIEDEDDYESDVIPSNQLQSNRHFAATDESQTYDGVTHASTSKCESGADSRPEPRGLIRNPIRITPRRVKTPFIGRNRKRKAGNKKNCPLNDTLNETSVTPVVAVPIKEDPDTIQLIRCSLCPRVFSQSSSLGIHMKRIHADEHKEHICHLCGKKYSWRSGLYKHMRTHRNR